VFDLSPEKLLVLGLVALFVVGPERLPAAAAWLGQAWRRVKEITAVAQHQIRQDLGPELAQLQQPLDELRVPLRELHAWRQPATVLASRLLDSTPPLGARPAATAVGGPAATPFADGPAATSVASGSPPPYDRDAT
jgi:sec-independent protein translocase protein TatB